MSFIESIAGAISRKHVVCFEYDGKYRTVEPHTIGTNHKSNVVLRGYQVGNEPGWRLFDVTKIGQFKSLGQIFEVRYADGYKSNDNSFITVIKTVGSMNVYYAMQDKSSVTDKSIFLAGPTPRSPSVRSWRPAALRELGNLGFDGSVFVPESSNWKPHSDYDGQIDWEWDGLSRASVVVFWVPRDLATMPAFTTNGEMGMIFERIRHNKNTKAVLGFPMNTPKMGYFERLAKSVGVEIHNSLTDTLKSAVAMI